MKRIILGLILCLGGMFCAVRALQATLELRRLHQVSNGWSPVEDEQKNWGLGASAGNLFGAVLIISGSKARKRALTSPPAA